MRLLWLPFCCMLAGLPSAQADSYRDRDEGFNPLNVMQGMPNPMGLFDSADRHRDDRPRRPPPPPPAPAYGYQAPPGYGMPVAPYYASPPAQAPLQPAPPMAVQPGLVPPATPQAMPPVQADTAQPAYQFRPMTSTETAPAAADPSANPVSEAQGMQPPSAPQQPVAQQPPQPPASGETNLVAPYPEQETPMVNGQPAVFRPMHLGVENPPTQ